MIKPQLAWLDIETTDLNPAKGRILEIGIILTNNDLVMVPDAFTSVVVPYAERDRRLDISEGRLAERIIEMHTANGLFDECAKEWDLGGSSHDALKKLLSFLKHFLPETGPEDGPLHDRLPIVCGNNVDFDRQFLRAHGYDDVLAHMHHRCINVSTLRELARRWYPATGQRLVEQAAAAGDEAVESWMNQHAAAYKKHRVLGDLRFAIAELNCYRSTVLQP